MTIKVTLSRNGRKIGNLAGEIRKARLEELSKARKEWLRKSRSLLEKEIKGSIERGVSPVKGEGRFEKYSDSYLNQIKKDPLLRALGKKARPVNLKLSGQLLNSYKTRLTDSGLLIYFEDKLADIHTRLGAGKSRVIRKMLPQRGEEFSRTMTKKLRDLLRLVIKKNI